MRQAGIGVNFAFKAVTHILQKLHLQPLTGIWGCFAAATEQPCAIVLHRMHIAFSFCKPVYHRDFLVGLPLPCWCYCTQTARLLRVCSWWGAFCLLVQQAAFPGLHLYHFRSWAPSCKVWIWIQTQFLSAFTGDLILGLGLLHPDQSPAAKLVFQPKLPQSFGVWGHSSVLAPFLDIFENSYMDKIYG